MPEPQDRRLDSTVSGTIDGAMVGLRSAFFEPKTYQCVFSCIDQQLLGGPEIGLYLWAYVKCIVATLPLRAFGNCGTRRGLENRESCWTFQKLGRTEQVQTI